MTANTSTVMNHILMCDLVNTLLSDPAAKIARLTSDNIIVNFRSGYTSASFSILQAFQKVIIKWKAKNPLGEFHNHWEFPESQDQHSMASIMFNDIENILAKGSDYDGLQSKIDDIIKNDLDSGNILPF